MFRGFTIDQASFLLFIVTLSISTYSFDLLIESVPSVVVDNSMGGGVFLFSEPQTRNDWQIYHCRAGLWAFHRAISSTSAPFTFPRNTQGDSLKVVYLDNYDFSLVR